MANTEGLTDEVVSSLLTISQDDTNPIRAPSNNNGPRFPRQYLARREQMMELGDGERPSARVIRSSKPPAVRSSTLSKKPTAENGGTTQSAGTRQSAHHVRTPQSPIQQDEEKHDEDTPQPKLNRKPVILSESIRERPVGITSNHPQSSSKKESRFKQRRKVTPTEGGFPSLDAAPVGSLTRKGRGGQSKESQSHSMPKSTPQTNNIDQGVGMASQSMLANMSLEEIREGIDEIQSILSPASIEFLRKRGQKKKLAANGKSNTTRASAARTLQSNGLSKDAQIELEEIRLREEKEKTAQILSSIRTPEDMDKAYNEALNLGLATELPTSTLETKAEPSDNLDVHMLTSLLRSTALRQRFLGVKSLSGILEQKFHDMMDARRAVSFSVDDNYSSNQTDYPPLLPVALRCLLDDAIAISHTSVGRSLLSLTLQSIQYLVMIFVHPYHLVYVNQTINNYDEEDPLVLSQTCFMSEISHIPAGSELYPPTTIEPMGEDGTNKGCYRADSSAASAESDSKAFYNDPAWTLLSRMRMIPCLSDALVCISRDALPDSVPFSDSSISSICGILALLSVRSPGVAAAVAGHKVLLPLIVTRCLSPNTINTDSTSVFRANIALPALKLLCLIAQQSKNIAELEIFESTIPDLHAILCLGNPSQQQFELQIASIVLIRILLRYGLALAHIQSLIRTSATQMTTQNRNDIRRHYIAVFSRVCDCAKMNSCASGDAKLETIHEEEMNDSLVLAGVWLSSAAKDCVGSLMKAMAESPALTKQMLFAQMKVAAPELEFLSSYLSATDPSSHGGNNPLWVEMKSSLIPSISMEYCNEVHSAVLNSPAFTSALDVALRWAFCVDWNASHDDTELSSQEQATACFFIASFMKFTSCFELDTTSHYGLVRQVLEVLKKYRAVHESTNCNSRCLHVAQQSWFVEAEFTILKLLCKADVTAAEADDVISGFAFSLLGRLAVGDEAIASFIFCQDRLFQVHATDTGSESEHLSNATFIQNAFLREMMGSEERKAQFEHSSALRRDATDLTSLRSSFIFGGIAEKACLLPLGGIWLWNVLSSTISAPSDSDTVAFPEDTSHKNTTDVVSHALGLLLRFETSSYSCPVTAGAKLYHLANVCMYPEAVLREDFVQSAVALLYGRFANNLTQSTLVSDFILACYHHSRISRCNKSKSADEKSTDSIFTPGNEHETISTEQLRALEDFVSDMCDSYIEHGGQYDMFTLFMRFFLRPGMPTKITSLVLSRLHPILNVLTLDEDRATTFSSLLVSVMGGLPSIDASRRDPGVILDAYSDALKKRDRELLRDDYIYLLAIAVLSRNLSLSSQRCECGVEAMKQRLSGLQSRTFYDIIKVSERFLHHGNGSSESLITVVMDICLVDEEGLLAQTESTQSDWYWDATTEDALWDITMLSLKSACKG